MYKPGLRDRAGPWCSQIIFPPLGGMQIAIQEEIHASLALRKTGCTLLGPRLEQAELLHVGRLSPHFPVKKPGGLGYTYIAPILS